MTTTTVKTRRPGARLRQLQALRPTTPAQLRRFVEAGLGLRLPPARIAGVAGVELVTARSDASCDASAEVCPAGSASLHPGHPTHEGTSVGGPFDYLADSYFDRPGDAVVWANRGGGKTMLGAVATLLDLLFKPGIQIRILGGSLEQAEKMYGYLRLFIDQPLLRNSGGVLASEPTLRRVLLQNGSRVELLYGSQRSVRGTRIQVLRCDEVDVMKRDVWDAAQLVTRSARCGGRLVPGRIEAFSTMHEVGGLMSELTASSRRQYRWNAMDVVARCPPERSCQDCPVWSDCQGKAKEAVGHLPVQDLIDQRGRMSDGLWDAEMMCRRPVMREPVYPTFNPERFIDDDEPWRRASKRFGPVWIGGMDFGYRNDTVVLWGWASCRSSSGLLHIVGEYIAKDRVTSDNLVEADATARKHDLPALADLHVLAVDPAGKQTNGQTGISDVQLLREAGCTVRMPRSPLRVGLEAVRRRMDHRLLKIHPRCTGLIESLQKYQYNPRQPQSETPVKNGPDHACDALRYLVLALDRHGGKMKGRRY